jgi:hypothetical protein
MVYVLSLQQAMRFFYKVNEGEGVQQALHERIFDKKQ